MITIDRIDRTKSRSWVSVTLLVYLVIENSNLYKKRDSHHCAFTYRRMLVHIIGGGHDEIQFKTCQLLRKGKQ